MQILRMEQHRDAECERFLSNPEVIKSVNNLKVQENSEGSKINIRLILLQIFLWRNW